MIDSKIRLSSEELELMKNSQWILTKNGVIDKMITAFAALSEWMKDTMEDRSGILPATIFHQPPKISRGEKYNGLPYIVLDYPRRFAREDILAVRTFFWWGHHCSVTLHCRGAYLSLIKQRLANFSGRDYCIAFEGDEWVHDLYADPHISFNGQQIPEKAEFIRIGRTCGISDWKNMENELQNGFLDLLTLLKPAD